MNILSEAAAEAFEARGINAETAVRLGVFSGTVLYKENPETGDKSFDRVDPDPSGDVIVFPFIEGGETVNEKYRRPGKKFAQLPGGKRTFWNADVLDAPELQDGRAALLIAEGELDGLTYIDCGYPFTVSVPDGANLPPKNPKPDEPIDDSSGKFEFLWNNRDRLKKIKRFIIAMDNDAAGQHMASELVRRLSASRCSFLTYPKDCKDGNDVRMKHGADAVRAMVDGAQLYPVKGVFSLNQYPDAPPIETFSTGWETVDQHFKLFTPGLVVVSGVPAKGKSTWVNHLLINAAALHGWKASIFSPEMPVVPHLRDKMRRCAGDAPIGELFRSGRVHNIDRWLEEYFTFIDHDFDGDDEDVTLEWILERAVDAVLRHGIRILVIDPWNEIEHARRREETMNEYITRALRLLKKFARKYDLMIIVVAHPTKDVGKDGKSRVPTLYDIEHSAAWFNKPDVGIIVEVENFDSNETQLHFQKVRFEGVGMRGKVIMSFNPTTGRFSLLDAAERARMMDMKAYGVKK